MMARSSYGYPRGKTWRGVAGTIAAAIFLVSLFVVSVYWFRQQRTQPPEAAPPFLAEEEPLPALDLESTNARLEDVTGGSASGQATREMTEGLYRHTVKASLPPIDRENFFYEGWLLRPVPFHYFSTGEMVTNSLGEFVLEWEGKKGQDYRAYTRVIITIEAKDGNPDPAAHIVEGTFGN